MNEKVRCIYKILTELEKAMDAKKGDSDNISCEALGVSGALKYSVIRMLLEAEYIAGGALHTNTCADAVITIAEFHDKYLYITLKGIEFLHENSLMKKMRADEEAYNYEEIEKELGYGIEKASIVCEPLKLDELRKLLEAGWVIYDTQPTSEKHIKMLTLVDSRASD